MSFTFGSVDYVECLPFLLNIHYAHRVPCLQYKYGMFDDGKLIGVCTFGQPASPFLCKGIAGEENRSKVIELNRLCFLPSYNGNNHASMLVSYSLKQLPRAMIVVSYADFGLMGHVGYVYQATNWMFTGTTKPRTDMKSESGHSRHNCGDSSQRQNRTAKHRYIYITGTKNDKRNLLKKINYPIIREYPKTENNKEKTCRQYR